MLHVYHVTIIKGPGCSITLMAFVAFVMGKGDIYMWLGLMQWYKTAAIWNCGKRNCIHVHVL